MGHGSSILTRWGFPIRPGESQFDLYLAPSAFDLAPSVVDPTVLIFILFKRNFNVEESEIIFRFLLVPFRDNVLVPFRDKKYMLVPFS